MKKTEHRAMILKSEKTKVIKKYIREKGIKYSIIARELGIVKTSFSNYINGNRKFSEKFGERLYNLLEKPEELQFLLNKDQYTLLYVPRTGSDYKKQEKFKYIRVAIHEKEPKPWVQLYRQKTAKLYEFFNNQDENGKIEIIGMVVKSFLEYSKLDLFEKLFHTSLKEIFSLYYELDQQKKIEILSKLEKIISG